MTETRGEIVTYGGAPAQTFYFSSSGGRTISSLDAFGTDVPYLVAVDDAWDEVSPNHRWPTQLLTGAQLAKRAGVSGVVTDVAFVAGAPGRPAAIRLTTTAGSSDVRLTDVRARLGLKSTGFRLGTLRLDGPAAAAHANAALRLTGLARDIEDVVLERRAGRGHVDQGPSAPPRRGWDIRSDAPPRRHDRVPAVGRRPRRACSHGPDQGVSGRALVGALAGCAVLAVPGVACCSATTSASHPAPSLVWSPPPSSAPLGCGPRASSHCGR